MHELLRRAYPLVTLALLALLAALMLSAKDGPGGVPAGCLLPRVDIPANPSGKALRYPGLVVVLDPGHGTMDVNGKITGQGASAHLGSAAAERLGLKTGKGGTVEIPEERLTLDYGMRLLAELRSRGVSCYSTRSYEPGDERTWFKVDYKGHDQEANNKLRAEWAEQHKAVLFLRIHFDGSENKSDSGYSIWYNDQSIHDKDGSLKAASMAASKAIDRELAKVVKIEDLGLKRFERPIYGFKHASMPAVLLELAYLSNPDDADYVAREDSAASYAEAIAAGVEDYLKTAR